jgi:nuclear transcription Y subunit beta
MKNTLPENAKIAKDSKETVQECVSEFISFITSEASDKCLQEKRKTINGDDLLWAMSTLGFDKYVEPLKLYLSKYREAVRGDKPENSNRGPTGGPPDAAGMGGAAEGYSNPS